MVPRVNVVNYGPDSKPTKRAAEAAPVEELRMTTGNAGGSDRFPPAPLTRRRSLGAFRPLARCGGPRRLPALKPPSSRQHAPVVVLEARHFRFAARAMVAANKVRVARQRKLNILARNAGVVRHVVPKTSNDPTVIADDLLSPIRFHHFDAALKELMAR